jgi:hypothetical protein
LPPTQGEEETHLQQAVRQYASSHGPQIVRQHAHELFHMQHKPAPLRPAGNFGKQQQRGAGGQQQQQQQRQQRSGPPPQRPLAAAAKPAAAAAAAAPKAS